MTWTVAKESGAVAAVDWMAEAASEVSAEQRALLEAFRTHPPISLKLTFRGLPDPFELALTEGSGSASPARFDGGPASVDEDLLDRLPLMILSIDADGTIEGVNRAGADLLGYVPEDLVGRQALSLFAESSRSGMVEAELPRMLATGRLVNVAVQLLARSGEAADLRMTAVGDQDGSGSLGRTMAVFAPAG